MNLIDQDHIHESIYHGTINLMQNKKQNKKSMEDLVYQHNDNNNRTNTSVMEPFLWRVTLTK